MVARKVLSGEHRGTEHRTSQDPDRPLTPGRLMRRAPIAVWLLVGLHGLMLLCWSVLTPQFHAPDEPNHAEAVMRLETGQGWGGIGRTFLGYEGIGAIKQSPYGTPARPYNLDGRQIRQADVVPRDARPDWADVDADVVWTGARPIQQLVQHPPGYYWLAAGAVALTGGEDQPWDRAVGVMRVLSAILVAPLPLFAWAATFRLSGDRRAALGAAVVPLAIPQLTHIGGSVNNDNLLVCAGGLVAVGLACVLRGDRSLRTAVFVGVTLGVALFSKSLALALLPVVLLAYLVPWVYERRRVPDALSEAPMRADAPVGRSRIGLATVLRPLVVVGALAFAIGGWWYAINLARYGAIQPSVPGFPPGKFLGDDDALFFDYATRVVLLRYWGNFGWFETILPWTFVYTAFVAVSVLLLIGLVRAARPRGLRWALLVMLAPTAGTYVLMVKTALGVYLRTGYYSALSGRYLFVGVVGVAVVVGLGAAGVPKVRRWSPLVLLLGAGVMQFGAIRVVTRRWWEPPGGTLRQAWGALSSWSPWSPRLVQLALLMAVLFLVLVVAELVRSSRHDDPPDEGEPARPTGQRATATQHDTATTASSTTAAGRSVPNGAEPRQAAPR